MDTKTIALSLLVALIMGSSGAVVYTLNTSTVDTEEEKIETIEENKVENYPPKLMIDEEIWPLRHAARSIMSRSALARSAIMHADDRHIDPVITRFND